MPPQIANVLSNSGQTIPAPVPGMAIIDTGATMTCVHEAILTALGLNPIGVVTAVTASGLAQQNVYPARLVFPTTGWVFDFQQVAGVNLSNQIVAISPSPQPAIALLGRNILQNWILVWNGPAAFWSVSF